MASRFAFWLLIGVSGFALSIGNAGFEFTEVQLDNMYEKLTQLAELIKSNTEAMQTFQQNKQRPMEEKIKELTELVKSNAETINSNEQAVRKELEKRITQATETIKNDKKSIEGILKSTTDILSHITCQLQHENLVCRTSSSGDGWIVIQQRFDNSVSFDRDWADYQAGFGSVGPGTEFWIGLNRIHQLTKASDCELLLEFRDNAGEYRFARYSEFGIEDESDGFRLSRLAGYSGTAGDVLTLGSKKIPKGQKFTTRDKDNDDETSSNCAADYHGGWWYKRCGDGLNENTIRWLPWKGEHLAYSRMLIRTKY